MSSQYFVPVRNVSLIPREYVVFRSRLETLPAEPVSGPRAFVVLEERSFS